MSSGATEQAKGEQLVSSHVSQDVRVASAQSTSSTPQPQLQTPSPYVSALHHQCGGTSQRVLSSEEIADGHGPFPHEPTAAQSVQLATLVSGQSRSGAPQPHSHDLPSPYLDASQVHVAGTGRHLVTSAGSMRPGQAPGEQLPATPHTSHCWISEVVQSLSAIAQPQSQ